MTMMPAISTQRVFSKSSLHIGLIVALLFTLWHAALHDVDLHAEDNVHVECETCRINHVPVADLPSTHLSVLPVLLSFSFYTPVTQQTYQTYYYTTGARAPPRLA